MCMYVRVIDGPVVDWKQLLVVCLARASVPRYPTPCLPAIAHGRSSICISADFRSVMIYLCVPGEEDRGLGRMLQEVNTA